MTVQAMFYVKEKREMTTGGKDPDRVVEVTLAAAFGTYLKGLPENEANKEWSKYTPTGELKMTITNPAAFDQFDIGCVYKLSFDKVA
ncbi:hypothetical protein [Reyranella sp.]|uniref:hypothetical protein n=1 Tax=Reyranella sp. TaxID=1929291 RepID=UPI003F70E434